MKKIYVGNLSFKTTEEELRAAFAPFGVVSSVNVVTDRMSGRPRGFGFVEMENDEEAEAAIQGLNGKDLGGRALNVNEAKPQEERSGGGRRGGSGGGGGRSRGGPGGGRGRSSGSSAPSSTSDQPENTGRRYNGSSPRPENDEFASGL